MTSNGIVQKLWNYCNVLRDDGLVYGDYVEQLTYPAFPQDGRRADEAAVQPAGASSRRISIGRAWCDWMAMRWRRITATS